MISLAATKSALAAGLTASFLASDGVEPYAYTVLPGGAGGTIDAVTGLYTAPPVLSTDPKLSSDTIQVTDAAAATALLSILVAHPINLVCEILQKELGLAPGRVYLWDQKIKEPTDSDLYVVVSVTRSKMFANTRRPDTSGSGLVSAQSANVRAELSLDIKSRSLAALLRKEQVLLALHSQYAETQQSANSFAIGPIPIGGDFLDLSALDGAAIPYWFRALVAVQYFETKAQPTDYFDTFATVQTTTQS